MPSLENTELLLSKQIYLYSRERNFTMTRETSDCQTFTSAEQGMPEPENEDFFDEVVRNSARVQEENAALAAELQGKKRRVRK